MLSDKSAGATVTAFDLDHIFQYHAPDSNDLVKYHDIREAGKTFAEVILKNIDSCADQEYTIRLIREAVMFANAAIALKGRLKKVVERS